MNSLTAQEKAQGWQLLFDGKTLERMAFLSSSPGPGPSQHARATAGATGALAQVGSTPKPCVARQKIVRRTRRQFSLGSRGWIADAVRRAVGYLTS